MQRHAARTCELLGRAALPELLGQQPLHERGNGARRCEAVAVEEVLHQQHCAQMNSRSCQSFICGQCPVSKYTIDQVQTIHSWKLPCMEAPMQNTQHKACLAREPMHIPS